MAQPFRRAKALVWRGPSNRPASAGTTDATLSKRLNTAKAAIGASGPNINR